MQNGAKKKKKKNAAAKTQIDVITEFITVNTQALRPVFHFCCDYFTNTIWELTAQCSNVSLNRQLQVILLFRKSAAMVANVWHDIEHPLT